MAAGSKKRKKSKEAPRPPQAQGQQQGHAGQGLADGQSDVQGQEMKDGRALIFVRMQTGADPG